MEKAALSLAAAAVSPILAKLGTKAAPFFGGDITDEELQDLRIVVLPKLQMVAKAAPGVDALKRWLRALLDAAYEVEDVLDLYEYEHLKAEVRSLHVDPFRLKSELMKSIGKLQQSAAQADKLIPLFGSIGQILSPQDTVKQVPTVSSPLSPVFFGRDKERDLLVGMLISTSAVEHSGSQRHTPVLAIWGPGGAGKTTLARQVYVDSRVVEHFDTRIWVLVSQKFDAHQITTQIIECIAKDERSSSKITNPDALQMRLKKILKSKKSLLVLDDVRCQDNVQWDQMLDPLTEALNPGSRILVTTRAYELASKLGPKNIVAVKDLDYKHCMLIFKHYAFGDANKDIHDPELAAVAEQIVEKFKKSPLSATMVGILLRGKIDVAVWKHILQKDDIMKDTLDALCLSFDSLAPHLQCCLAFCSLFPKGYHFDVNLLVRFWIAHGFTTAEQEGMRYFEELLSSSFFQQVDENIYVIHDMFHDLVEKISEGHCLRIEGEPQVPIPKTIKHLSVTTKSLPFCMSHICDLVNLRTFIIEDDCNNIIADAEIFAKMKKLRLLHFGRNSVPELHSSISQLKHLRYLQLQGVEKLPESLSELYQLQFLDCGRSDLSGKLPKSFNNLVNLRFLHAESEIITEVPFFGKLVSFQNILNYDASNEEGHEIGQLKNLRQLRGSLCLNKLENVQGKAKASEASLKEKKLLDDLALRWEYSPERDGTIDEEVAEGLEPPPKLNFLEVAGYNGVGFPKWLTSYGERWLCLSYLQIEDCPKLMRIPSLPSKLSLLMIMGCESLSEVAPLPQDLKVVWVEDCPKLTQLSRFPPRLQELKIKRCPGVKTLLSNVLLFDSEEDLRRHQENNSKESFPLEALTIMSIYLSGEKKLFFGPSKLFTSLSELTLWDLPWLTSLHLHHNLSALKSVSVNMCENLESLYFMPSISSIERLDISFCPNLKCADELDEFHMY